MAELVYATIASLDGYIAAQDGNFDWAEPDEEVHAFVNDIQRRVGTFLFGRRMYEVMLAWETLPIAGEPAFVQDFAEIWRSADKVVYSSTLQTVSSARTTIERAFVPEAVLRMKAEAERDLAIGGPQLAAHAIGAGLVDQVHLFVSPVVIGGGTRAFPDDLRLQLQLMDERRFRNGVVYLGYRVATTAEVGGRP